MGAYREQRLVKPENGRLVKKGWGGSENKTQSGNIKMKKRRKPIGGEKYKRALQEKTDLYV